MQNYVMKIPGWHTQGEIERKLLFANIGGVFVTFVFGASFIPWLWHLVQWGASHLPPWQPTIPFPNPLEALIHPNWLTGGIWLAYYLLLYAIALLNPRYSHTLDRQLTRYRSTYHYTHSIYNTAAEWDIQQKRQRQAQVLGPFLYRPIGGEPEEYEGTDSLFSTGKPKHIPLSQAWEGEAKYELVERCYAIYRKVLKERYDPAPLELKTPPTFFYWEKKYLGYHGSYPILPEEFLTEEKFEVLLTLLAQHIYFYNLRELGEMLSGTLPSLTPEYQPGGWLTGITGSFLWIPANAAWELREDLEQLIHTHQKALILEADAFAALVGQGEQYELQLRIVQWQLQQHNLADDQEPTLSERIGHLEALNKKARNELRAQGFKVKEPPKFQPPADEWDLRRLQIIEEDKQRRLGPGKHP
jgi:hypothetical protein